MTPRRRSCPRCAVEMTDMARGAVEALRCPLCRGFWIHQEGLAHDILTTAGQKGVRLPGVSFLEGPAARTDLPCPDCEAKMLETLTLRGVAVERCPACAGLFLQEGEGELITRRVLHAGTQFGPLAAELSRLIQQRRRHDGHTEV